MQPQCRECQRDYKLKYRYGISMSDALRLLANQDSRCAICERLLDRKSFVIDHCHTTHAVRGVLCNACNVVLGQAYDSVAVLQKAIKYLNERSKR